MEREERERKVLKRTIYTQIEISENIILDKHTRTVKRAEREGGKSVVHTL